LHNVTGKEWCEHVPPFHCQYNARGLGWAQIRFTFTIADKKLSHKAIETTDTACRAFRQKILKSNWNEYVIEPTFSVSLTQLTFILF